MTRLQYLRAWLPNRTEAEAILYWLMLLAAIMLVGMLISWLMIGQLLVGAVSALVSAVLAVIIMILHTS